MNKRHFILYITILLTGVLNYQEPAFSSHTKFLETLSFPVIEVNSHFYDDWGEIRGNGARAHEGIDIRAPKGSPIVAVADGRVNTLAYSEASGYYIAIDHGNGWLSLYVHLNDDISGNDNLGGPETAFAEKIYVGASVIGGQTIGFIGDSGNAEGTVPHVHFEMRYQGSSYDVYPWILDAWKRFENYIYFPKKINLRLF